MIFIPLLLIVEEHEASAILNLEDVVRASIYSEVAVGCSRSSTNVDCLASYTAKVEVTCRIIVLRIETE
jgi:hypothetical protein